jgi:hypothetical protein
MIEGMMGAMEITAEVIPVEETKEINGYKCKKYNIKQKISMAEINSVAWVTEDIKVDHEMMNLLTSAVKVMFKGFTKSLEEMAKIKGVTVYSEGKVLAMGTEINTTTSLLEAGEKEAPEGTYDIPEDYSKVAYQLPQMGGR